MAVEIIEKFGIITSDPFFKPNDLIATSKAAVPNNFIKLIVSVSVIYLLGVLWLSKFTGWDNVFTLGVKPFLLAELFKVSLLSFLISVILKFRKL